MWRGAYAAFALHANIIPSLGLSCINWVCVWYFGCSDALQPRVLPCRSRIAVLPRGRYDALCTAGCTASLSRECLTAAAPQASNKEVLSAYSRFYSLLLTSGYDSWQDYVLDQVEEGEGRGGEGKGGATRETR